MFRAKRQYFKPPRSNLLKPRPDWSPFGVKFKISDEHPRLFHMGVSPGVADPIRFVIIEGNKLQGVLLFWSLSSLSVPLNLGFLLFRKCSQCSLVSKRHNLHMLAGINYCMKSFQLSKYDVLSLTNAFLVVLHSKDGILLPFIFGSTCTIHKKGFLSESRCC